MQLAQGSFTPPRGDAKRSYVKEMFTAIAPRYDLLNHVLSLNIDRRWRRLAVNKLGWESASHGTYLDLCAGTMDLAAELARRKGFEGRVIGADFVLPMLSRGVGKAGGLSAVGADALLLPFEDAQFAGCTVGFGVRNLAELDRGLKEMARVLRPGGRLVVLEFSTPTRWPARHLYLFYFRRLLPLIGKIVSRHGTAYSYLPSSVLSFPDGDEFLRCMETAGFANLSAQRLTMGIATLYVGTRS